MMVVLEVHPNHSKKSLRILGISNAKQTLKIPRPAFHVLTIRIMDVPRVKRVMQLFNGAPELSTYQSGNEPNFQWKPIPNH